MEVVTDSPEDTSESNNEQPQDPVGILRLKVVKTEACVSQKTNDAAKEDPCNDEGSLLVFVNEDHREHCQYHCEAYCDVKPDFGVYGSQSHSGDSHRNHEPSHSHKEDNR